MKKSFKVLGCLSLLGAIALTSGCASILNEKTQTVNVGTSNGAAITVKVEGQQFSAPGIVKLERENKSKVFITDASGCTKETSVEPTVDMKFFINILSGGAFGSSTDFSTGYMWKYSENVTINCQK